MRAEWGDKNYYSQRWSGTFRDQKGGNMIKTGNRPDPRRSLFLRDIDRILVVIIGHSIKKYVSVDFYVHGFSTAD